MNAYPWLPPHTHPAAIQPRQSLFAGSDEPTYQPDPKNAPEAVYMRVPAGAAECLRPGTRNAAQLHGTAAAAGDRGR